MFKTSLMESCEVCEARLGVRLDDGGARAVRGEMTGRAWIEDAPGASADVASSTGGSGSYSTRTWVSASSAAARSVAATAATESPT